MNGTRAAIAFCITSNLAVSIFFFLYFVDYKCVFAVCVCVCVFGLFFKEQKQKERERESESTILERIEVKDSQIRFDSNVPRTS